MLKKVFTLAVSTVFAASAWAADAGSSSFSKDDMMKELQTLRQQAAQVATIAKHKRSTANDVRTAAEAALESSKKLHAMVRENPSFFGPANSERLNQITMTANIMEVLATNKINMLDEYEVGRNRTVVRGKAMGLVDRVDRLERAISGQSI